MLPEELRKHIPEIVKNCEIVTKQMNELLLKLQSGKLGRRIQWALAEKQEMNALRSSLESNKTALGVALTVGTISLLADQKAKAIDQTKDITAMVENVRDISTTTSRIDFKVDDLAEGIAELRGQLAYFSVASKQQSTGHVFVEQSKAYAESTLQPLKQHISVRDQMSTGNDQTFIQAALGLLSLDPPQFQESEAKTPAKVNVCPNCATSAETVEGVRESQVMQQQGVQEQGRPWDLRRKDQDEIAYLTEEVDRLQKANSDVENRLSARMNEMKESARTKESRIKGLLTELGLLQAVLLVVRSKKQPQKYYYPITLQTVEGVERALGESMRTLDRVFIMSTGEILQLHNDLCLLQRLYGRSVEEISTAAASTAEQETIAIYTGSCKSKGLVISPRLYQPRRGRLRNRPYCSPPELLLLLKDLSLRAFGLESQGISRDQACEDLLHICAERMIQPRDADGTNFGHLKHFLVRRASTTRLAYWFSSDHICFELEIGSRRVGNDELLSAFEPHQLSRICVVREETSNGSLLSDTLSEQQVLSGRSSLLGSSTLTEETQISGSPDLNGPSEATPFKSTTLAIDEVHRTPADFESEHTYHHNGGSMATIPDVNNATGSLDPKKYMLSFIKRRGRS
ncbi:hypothetical protein OHC33_002643 [Knufia fluminis]|uniref:Uncharacterized protein n=1 Tax=Knufia fluminis TaxID=191047 RepID=A0AAN8EUD5_9EURO|nr:hypothetical protein OHC33_002643 [Knufia fluminis]